MNFNSDLPKIPSYPIPGLTELVDELPHTGHHQLSHHESRHESQRILNTPDAALMSQIVNAISNTPTELMNTQPGNIDGINNSPFYQVLNRSNEMFAQRNLQQSGILPSHLGVYPQHNVLPGSSIQSNYPPANDTSTSRINPIYPGGNARPAVSRPVQAVAPQPRHPRQYEKPGSYEVEPPAVVESNVKSKLEVTPSHLPQTISTPPTETPEENKKICLKIRRTKKSHKSSKDRHSGGEQPEYGIVSDNNSENNNGPIKLKISRLKPSTSGDQTTNNSTEEAFQVSSLTTAGYTTKIENEAPLEHDTEQRKAEDAASAMVREIFKHQPAPAPSGVPQYGGYPQMATSQTPVTKPPKIKSKSERKSHKHRSHSSSGSKSETKRSSYVQPPVLQPPTHGAYPYSVNQLPPNQHYHQNVAKHCSVPIPQKHQQHPDLNYHNSLQSSQSHMYSNSTESFVSPPGIQQNSYQQPHLMHLNDTQGRSMSYLSHNKNLMPGVNYPPQVQHTDLNSANFMQKKAWDSTLHQPHHYQMPKQPSQPITDPKPPPYNEALIQQNQLYSNMFQPSGSLIDNNLMMQQQEHNIMQQKLKKMEEQKKLHAIKQQQQQQTEDAIKMQPQYRNNTNYPSAIQIQQQPFYTPPDPQQSMYSNSRLTSPQMQPTPEQHKTYRPPQTPPSHFNAHVRDSSNTINYMNAPEHKSSSVHHRSSSKSKKRAASSGGIDHVRVKFVADSEEADIYKLKDILYQDDTEVNSFSELEPGTQVVAKWPMNGKLYAAVVINPLDNTGRRFRERKPPPKPFQIEPNFKKERLPSVVLDKLTSDDLPYGITVPGSIPDDVTDPSGGFGAYVSMADRIKMKKREREGRIKEGKKRKWKDVDHTPSDLINIHSDEEFQSPAPKRSNKDEQRRRERRRAMESRMMQEDGAGSLNRLMAKINSIFEDMDDLDPQAFIQEEGEEMNVHPGLLISRSKLQDLNGETARMKSRGFLSQLSKKMLIRFLTILESNIRSGARLKPMHPKGESQEEQKWNRECNLDRVNNSTEAATVAMNILTAPFMPKAVYIDDVMERSAMLLKYQLTNTIYPEYDLVYKAPAQKKKKGGKETFSNASLRMKRAHFKGSKNKSVVQLYNKLNVLLNQWVELVSVQPLTDTTVLMISTVGVTPFFVENIHELQLSAIRLTTVLFSRYEKHRTLMLEDILQSLARLPTSKRNLRSYRLTHAEEAVDSSDEEEDTKKRIGGKNSDLQYIQMLTALILQMLHSVVHLAPPEEVGMLTEEEITPEERNKQIKMEKDVNEMKVITSYDAAERTAKHFVSVFLKKCSTKSDETDFRPLFENFVHDLLSTVNKPEWPAAEMLLSLLGRLLVLTFKTKSSEMSLRVASLDYLGVVAAKLRRDAVSSHDEVATIRALLQRLEDAVAEQEGDVGKEESLDAAMVIEEEPLIESDDAILTRKLQYLLLGYLRKNAASDSSLLYAHNFYIGQWLRDCSVEFQQLEQDPSRKKDAGEQLDNLSLKLQLCQKKKDALLELASSAASASAKISGELSTEEQKKLKISAEQKHADKLAAGLTVEDATLVSRHLASTLPFSRSFDCYLTYIIHMAEDSAVALRTRSIKCLAEVVSVDPSIMERNDIANGVQKSLTDNSTSVREAAIDLVGRFILLRPNLVKHYYSMLIARILDTGVSVRKRVIRILRDLFHEHPDLPQLTDACVKMIRRVNDEDGIKKLVHEVFMKMWFTPVDSTDTDKLRKKALLITDIVSANRDRGYEWIEQLFKNLIDTPERNADVEIACQQIVDCLVQHVIIFENPDEPNKGNMNIKGENSKEENNNKLVKVDHKKNHTVRLVATIQTLVQLAKIRPRLLVPHVVTLQPYLASKCENNDDFLVCTGVCRTLELAVPLMEHPSEIFLKSVEEDVMRLILTQPYHLTAAAISCLAAVICKVTKNYQLVWDCFNKLCGTLAAAHNTHRSNAILIFQPAIQKQLLRTVFIVGNFCKNFDFDDENLKGKTSITDSVKDKVYDVLFYFSTIRLNKITEKLKVYAITALGSLMIKDPNMMFRPKTRELYKLMLEQNQESVQLKKQVLLNLQSYLQIEDVQMQEAAEASAKKSKQHDGEVKRRESFNTEPDDEDIKEICDVSSGMASSVMQLFLKQVLDAIFHPHVIVRHAALHTIFLTLQQGLVHPGQCVPYLIAAASDPTPAVHKEADQQLTELNKRYSGFVQVSALQGLKLSFQLQSCMTKKGNIVRGWFEYSVSEDVPSTRKASCAHLYQLIRSDRKFRRSFLLNLLNLFDDTVKTDLKLLLFVADNLAYFPYHTYDEPLYLMSQIDVYVSVSGSNVLQTFKESLQVKHSKQEKRDERRRKKLEKKRERQTEEEGSSSSSSSESSSSEEEDNNSEIASRLPLEDESLTEFAQLSLACLLLFRLKSHLKTLFGFTENKIRRYSTTEVNRANDKQIHRKVVDLKFEPMLALEHLERIKKGVSCRSPEYRAAVVKQYTEFNELINKLDPNEDDSDSDKEKKTSNNQTTPIVKTEITPSKVEEIEDSDRDTDNEVHKPVVPLDAIRRSTALKSKKRHRERKKVDKTPDLSHFNTDPPERRKRASVKYAESSSGSEDDFRGF